MDSSSVCARCIVPDWPYRVCAEVPCILGLVVRLFRRQTFRRHESGISPTHFGRFDNKYAWTLWWSVGGDTTAPSGLYAGLCHTFLVYFFDASKTENPPLHCKNSQILSHSIKLTWSYETLRCLWVFLSFITTKIERFSHSNIIRWLHSYKSQRDIRKQCCNP